MTEHPSPDTDGPERYVSKIDRRATLAWLASVAGVAVAGSALAQSPNDRADKPIVTGVQNVTGYGTDPELVKPKPAPWPRLMTKAQLQTAALLCDFILPASGSAPSANALHVPDFIDEWVSAPYPQQLADRPVILEGLAWVEAQSRRRYGKGLFDVAPAERTVLLNPLTTRSSDPVLKTPHAFFRKFRSLTIGAYYTTRAGFKDIGYIGNVPRIVDEGPSLQVKAALDAAFTKLRL